MSMFGEGYDVSLSLSHSPHAATKTDFCLYLAGGDGKQLAGRRRQRPQNHRGPRTLTTTRTRESPDLPMNIVRSFTIEPLSCT